MYQNRLLDELVVIVVLSYCIGIMNYGKLCCLGSQNKLKARFGSGYQLHINCYSGRSSGGCGWYMSCDSIAPPLTAIQQFMSSHFSSATLVEYYASKLSTHTVTFQLLSFVCKLYEVFTDLGFYFYILHVSITCF